MGENKQKQVFTQKIPKSGHRPRIADMDRVRQGREAGQENVRREFVELVNRPSRCRNFGAESVDAGFAVKRFKGSKLDCPPKAQLLSIPLEFESKKLNKWQRRVPLPHGTNRTQAKRERKYAAPYRQLLLGRARPFSCWRISRNDSAGWRSMEKGKCFGNGGCVCIRRPYGSRGVAAVCSQDRRCEASTISDKGSFGTEIGSANSGCAGCDRQSFGQKRHCVRALLGRDRPDRIDRRLLARSAWPYGRSSFDPAR